MVLSAATFFLGLRPGFASFCSEESLLKSSALSSFAAAPLWPQPADPLAPSSATLGTPSPFPPPRALSPPLPPLLPPLPHGRRQMRSSTASTPPSFSSVLPLSHSLRTKATGSSQTEQASLLSCHSQWPLPRSPLMRGSQSSHACLPSPPPPHYLSVCVQSGSYLAPSVGAGEGVRIPPLHCLPCQSEIARASYSSSN